MERYKYNDVYKDDNGKQYYSSIIYPYIQPDLSDIYIEVRKGERLDLLADKYYNDISMWWIIAEANNLGHGSIIIDTEQQLRIPSQISDIETKLRLKQI